MGATRPFGGSRWQPTILAICDTTHGQLLWRRTTRRRRGLKVSKGLVFHASAADHVHQQLQIRSGHDKLGVVATIFASIAGTPRPP